MEISRLIDERGLDDMQLQKDANTKLDDIALIVAVAMLNGKCKIKFFSGILSKFLLWKVPAYVIRQVYQQVAQLNKISDFMAITIYFGLHAQMMMNPKEMGRKMKGS